MFPAALLTIAKVWKQAMSTSGWVDQEDMVYTHTKEYYQLLKRKKIWNTAICDNMNESQGYYA